MKINKLFMFIILSLALTQGLSAMDHRWDALDDKLRAAKKRLEVKREQIYKRERLYEAAGERIRRYSALTQGEQVYWDNQADSDQTDSEQAF